MISYVESGAFAGSIGPIPRPEGEKSSGTAPTGEEESLKTLANSSRQGTSTTAVEAPLSTHEIVRATSKLAIEPWRLAEDPKLCRERKCQNCRACALYADLRTARRACARAANIALRALWQADGAKLDAFFLANGCNPKGDEWPLPKVGTDEKPKGLYGLARRAAPELPGAIASLVARQALRKWVQTRWNALVRMDCAPSHYREKSAPLLLRGAEVRAGLKQEGDEIVLHALLVAGGVRHRIPIVPRDDRQRHELVQLVNQDWRIGDAVIKQDRRRPGRWYLSFTHRRLVERSKGTRSAAVNRGIVCFLAAVTDKGQDWIYDGHDIEAYLKQIQRRRREYQNDSKASLRWGHGRARTLRPTESLQGKAERWRNTKCQTIAAQFARWLDANGVGLLFVEDFSGIRDSNPENLIGGEHTWVRIQEWPYYRLEQSIRSAVEARGIEVVSVTPGRRQGERPEYLARSCPSCGYSAEKNMQWSPRRFVCISCGWKRHLDVATAMNVLARGSGSR